nr:LOW QUALITY PROTEIN: hypothetical protein L203_02410 [Cryptococcus depauperatus CBS 7841]
MGKKDVVVMASSVAGEAESEWMRESVVRQRMQNEGKKVDSQRGFIQHDSKRLGARQKDVPTCLMAVTREMYGRDTTLCQGDRRKNDGMDRQGRRVDNLSARGISRRTWAKRLHLTAHPDEPTLAPSQDVSLLVRTRTALTYYDGLLRQCVYCVLLQRETERLVEGINASLTACSHSVPVYNHSLL